jgi:hypothetical protein
VHLLHLLHPHFLGVTLGSHTLTLRRSPHAAGAHVSPHGGAGSHPFTKLCRTLSALALPCPPSFALCLCQSRRHAQRVCVCLPSRSKWGLLVCRLLSICCALSFWRFVCSVAAWSPLVTLPTFTGIMLPTVCRVFAVGYAARQISSGAQLQRLLSNPPLAHGLQLPAGRWSIDLVSSMLPCATCGRLTSSRMNEMKDSVSH